MKYVVRHGPLDYAFVYAFCAKECKLEDGKREYSMVSDIGPNRKHVLK